jgi:prepilin-type N-terminal cleavage/methylation domain-containing protein
MENVMRLSQKVRDKQGFSLIELMVVVAIIGILAAIAIPLYRDYVEGGKASAAVGTLSTIALLEEQFFAENRSYVAFGETSSQAAVDAAKAALPGFEPGEYSELHFTYNVVAPTPTTFTATATKIGGGSVFTLNEQNQKTHNGNPGWD